MANSENLSAIRRHLDSAGDNYLNSINGTTPESLIVTIDKLRPIKQFARPGGTVVSIGVGQGEEIHALNELFMGTDTSVIGLDIADSALHKAAERIRSNELSASLIGANAAELPLADQSVNGVVLSAILHEIYSYHASASQIWEQTVIESARVLADNGVILLRDFAAPDLKDPVRLGFNNGLPKSFYNYFAKEFRAFNSWGIDGHAIREENPWPDDYFPAIDPDTASVVLPLDRVGELVLHYRNFWSDMQKGVTQIGDSGWKEVNEVYYVPSQSSTSGMGMNEYIERVVSVADHSLEGTGYRLVPVMRNVSGRPGTSEFLSRHFKVAFANAIGFEEQTTRYLIDQTTGKMEIILRKQKL
jgi:ubiquinone/menaquinone biosynthesis C-methylase UbiE